MFHYTTLHKPRYLDTFWSHPRGCYPLRRKDESAASCFFTLRAGEHPSFRAELLRVEQIFSLGLLLGQALSTMANGVPIDVVRLFSLVTLQLTEKRAFGPAASQLSEEIVGRVKT